MGSGHRIRTLFSLALAALLVRDTTGYVRTSEFENDHVFNELVPDGFGFEANGTITLDIKATPPEAKFFVVVYNYDQKDLQARHLSFYGPERVNITACNLLSERRFEVGGSWHMSINVSHRDMYWVSVVNCRRSKLHLTYKSTCINPNGNYLQYQEYPREPMAAVLSLAYGIMTVGWFVLYCRYHRQPQILQKLLGLAMFLKFIQAMLQLLYYHIAAVSGSVYTLFGQSKELADILTNAGLLAVLLLLALGWTVTRVSLSLRERQLFWGAFILYTLFGTLLHVCGDQTGFCNAYLLSFYVIKFLITFCIIVAMNANIDRLRSGSIDWPLPQSSSDLYTKLRMFTTFRWAFLAYLIMPILLMFIKVTMLSWQLDWADWLMKELVALAVYTVVGVIFRPTRAELFYSAQPYSDEQPNHNGTARRGIRFRRRRRDRTASTDPTADSDSAELQLQPNGDNDIEEADEVPLTRNANRA